MVQIDPLKLMRNSATLDAFRQHQRAVRAAAQPWLTIALAAALMQIGLFLYALFHNSFHDLSLISSLLMLVFGVSFLTAGVRAWLYRRSHPFALPEAPPVFRWRNNVR